MWLKTKNKKSMQQVKNQPLKKDTEKRLTAAQLKKIVRKIKLAKKLGKLPNTTQRTIPYQEMYRDGICRVNDRLYTKTVQFFDTNYQLAKNEDKDAIFESWCDFLNYFDDTIPVQLTFVNQEIGAEDFNKTIEIGTEGEDSLYAPLRKEFISILQSQYTKGNNHLRKSKYITFGLEADSLSAAKLKIDRVENEILNNFKTVGVGARPIEGYERLELLHGILHTGSNRKFIFNWDFIAKTGLTSKDFIVPDSFDFRERTGFRIGGKRVGSVSFLQILAPELSDKMLSDFLELDSSQIITMHIRSVDQAAAMKQVKGVITNMQMMKMNEQMKAARNGYDMDLLPPDLISYSNEAQDMLENLQSRNERMFLVTLLFLNDAADKSTLENNIFAAQGIATKYNCRLQALDFQQEAGLTSSLPIGANDINIKRVLTTSAAGVFIPFTTQEIFQPGGLYYGINAQSNHIVLADRKQLRCPNGLVLGTPGSGKSFSSKGEIVNVLLYYPNDHILIQDPEREYSPLVSAFGGQVIKISADSPHHINLMDINLDVHNEEDEDYDPLVTKSDFILSVCEQILGGRYGLEPLEISLIDRCVTRVYQEYLKDPRPENMPVWGNLYQALNQLEQPEAKRIAGGMEYYVMGSLKVFNHQTNVDIKNRLVAFDTKDLGQQLKKLGMLIVQDQVWTRVTINRSAKRTTWAYYDEFHLMLKEAQTAASSVEMWKRFRKWGGIPTGITQNVNDLLSSREISNIFQNSDFIFLLNQASEDRAYLARQLNISAHQLSFVTNSSPGEGLIYYGGTIVPFINRFPKDTELYRLMTTKPDEVGKSTY